MNLEKSWLDELAIEKQLPVGPQIYRALRHAIVSLRLEPGVQLKEKLVAEKIGCSRTPVRESILKLEDEGLIEIYPQRGTYVSRISMESFYESQFIRENIEAATCRYAAINGDHDLFHELEHQMHVFKESQIKDDRNTLFDADEDFHSCIASFRYKNRLWKMIELVKMDLDRIRLVVYNTDRMEAVYDEHKAVADAIISRDADAAEKAIRSHLRQIFNEVEGIKKERPEFFVD